MLFSSPFPKQSIAKLKGNKLIDDHKQISVNLLKFKSHGKHFEVAIEADQAVAFKQGKEVDIEEDAKWFEGFSTAP